MSTEVFSNAPLALVAFEARYTDTPDLISKEALDELKDLLHDSFPLRQDIEEQEISLKLGAQPVQAINHRILPRFTNREMTTACRIGGASVIVETTAYNGFPGFLSLIESVVAAVAKVRKPDGLIRLGLRYIDEVRVPKIVEPPGDWGDYIDAHLLATVAPEFTQSAGLTPRTWQSIVQYVTEGERTVLLRFGPSQGYAVPPEGPTRRVDPPPAGLFFLLDWDGYWEAIPEVPEFEPRKIVAVCEDLHQPIKALFDTVIEDKLRDVFRQISPGRTSS